MKKSILILLVATFVCNLAASSAPTDSTQMLPVKKDQLRNKLQIADEIIFVIRGVLMSGMGATRLSGNNDMKKAWINSRQVTAKVTDKESGSSIHTDNNSFTTSIAAIITGEPLFVVSSKHKKQMLSVSTTEQVIKKMKRNSISRVSIPSIKLTIHL